MSQNGGRTFPITPPLRETSSGTPRQIGVEIEFAGLDCKAAAAIIAQQFGGIAESIDPYRYLIETTAHGRFIVELDTQFVHPGETSDPVTRADTEAQRLKDALEEGLRTAIGEVTRLYLPTEVVAPPLPITALPDLDALAAHLRAAGARGTRDSVLYAFGLQLNIDMPALDPATVLAYLQAYLVSADWLRQDIGVDRTRRVLPFVQPFPRAYMRQVLQPGYAPDLAGLIDDYLVHNPTRNRDLDMLPLLTWLAPDRVRAAVDDPRLKARPALHYRLPDSRIEDPSWSIISEWNRWARTVEHLAANPGQRQAACTACLTHIQQSRLAEWADDALAWLTS